MLDLTPDHFRRQGQGIFENGAVLVGKIVSALFLAGGCVLLSPPT